MLITLSPSADSPPSANSRPCTTSTTVTARAPAYGPTRTAARTPPSRWPLVPLATGKLIIWTANTNAATSPTTGTSRSSSVLAVIRREEAITPTAISPATSDVGPSMNPSGMCIASTGVSSSRSANRSQSDRTANGSQTRRGAFAAAPLPDGSIRVLEVIGVWEVGRSDLAHSDGSGLGLLPAAPDDGEVRAVEHEVVVPGQPLPQRIEDVARDADVAAADLAHE